MPVDIEKIWLYRIVHIDNIEHILTHGIFSHSHSNADPEYVSIGDATLIIQRNDYPVKLDGYGNLGDYVPFYFGPLSPMLYNIKTGYRGITKMPQSDIVYLCCRFTDIDANCSQWVFTDGHAKSNLTEFFNSPDDFDKVDWTMVKERMWKNNEEDFDRMRRKQAEFLVKDQVPINCIGGIIVYNEEKKIQVQHIIDKLKLTLPVKVNTNYYY